MYVSNGGFTTEQKLMFCDDLLTRMLSGPGKLMMMRRNELLTEAAAGGWRLTSDSQASGLAWYGRSSSPSTQHRTMFPITSRRSPDPWI